MTTFDRRTALRVAGGVATAMALPGRRARAQADGGTIVFWQYRYNPGSDGAAYLDEAAARFKAATGITVRSEFKSAEGIEQAVMAAANAGQGFDAMNWWSGPTARNQGSLGNVIPLDDHFPAETWQNKVGLAAQLYQGKTYGMSHTVGPYFLVYNRTLLRKAGVDPDVFPAANRDPIAWADFIGVCEKVKAAGTAPLMWANKEGYFNEWYFYNFEGMGFDSTEEIESINSGKASFKNPAVYQALAAYKQLHDAGFFFEGGEVVAYEQHVRQLGSGQAAMGVYFDLAGGATAAAIETFGRDNIGFSRVPAYRTDKKLYGHSCLEPNSLYVAAFSDRQEQALKWIAFLVSVPEMGEFVKRTQLAPADTRWDKSLIKDKGQAAVYEGATAKGQVYPYTFVTQAQYNSLLQNGIEYLAGRWSAEELAADFDKVTAEYLQQQKG